MLVFLLLTSGCVALCSQLFEYHMVTEAKGMEEARRYCEEHYESLAVIRNRHDVERLAKRATASGVGFRFGHGFWIGLRLTEELTWQWSVEETDAGAGLAVYTNWANFLPDSSHHCGGMSANGSWVSDVCEATRPFVCQLGGALAVFRTGISWRSAQGFCRQNKGDLASARDETENRALHSLIKNASISWAWTGLFRDGWKWVNQSQSSFRVWHAIQRNQDGHCVLHDIGTNLWYNRNCAYKRYFFCQGVAKTQVHKYIVRVKWESDSSLNLNDAGVRETILKQLQEKHEGVKLQWIVPPDGNVFHKEKKKEVLDRACEDLN